MVKLSYVVIVVIKDVLAYPMYDDSFHSLGGHQIGGHLGYSLGGGGHVGFSVVTKMSAALASALRWHRIRMRHERRIDYLNY